MRPKRRCSQAFLVVGFISGIILGLSTNMPAATKRAADGRALQTPPMTSGTATRNDTKTLPRPNPRIAESYGRLPLSFEMNRGQTDSRVRFLSGSYGGQPGERTGDGAFISSVP
jgi:hypothetical protein